MPTDSPLTIQIEIFMIDVLPISNHFPLQLKLKSITNFNFKIGRAENNCNGILGIQRSIF